MPVLRRSGGNAAGVHPVDAWIRVDRRMRRVLRELLPGIRVETDAAVPDGRTGGESMEQEGKTE